jgi:serine/threonine protein kinase
VLERLHRPGICSVLDVGEVKGTPYFVMEFIAGESLADSLCRARHRPIGPSCGGLDAGDRDAMIRAIELVARALHVAHEAGVVHRDLKPSNVMIEASGRPVVIDFGLAQTDTATREQGTAREEVSIGTPAYMPPEQIAPPLHSIDRRADVFSLGATLFECLTLHRPFDDEDADPGARRAPDARRFVPSLPVELCAILTRAMATDPDRRHATAAEFADDLARFLPQSGT